MPDTLISHQPLVNRQSKIIATRLTLHLGAGGRCSDAVRSLNAIADVWPAGDKPVFVSCGKIPCDATFLQWTGAPNATLELQSGPFVDAGAADFVARLKELGLPLCLDFDANAAQVLSTGAQFRFIGFDAQSFTPAQLRVLATKTQPYGIPLAFNVETAQEFQSSLDAGMTAAASWFFKRPVAAPAKALNPAQAQIIRVLNLVRKNADVKEIEAALKHDVALSYKLLRYINSAGFGLSCEIQSFRHAVTILGYEKLNKWLSLLLATAGKDPMATAMLHTALTRARLMELLAQGLVDRREYDNLFITGAFSLLDALLGVGMEQVLESMHLPEPISDALLGNEGMYGPFLDLAVACEGSDGEAIAEQVGMLGLSAEHFNRAQLQALAFADAMEF